MSNGVWSGNCEISSAQGLSNTGNLPLEGTDRGSGRVVLCQAIGALLGPMNGRALNRLSTSTDQNRATMKKITTLLIVCSVALAGAVMAQQPTPETEQSP